jgi:hypothetical protein
VHMDHPMTSKGSLASQSTTGRSISPWHGICSLVALAEISQHAARLRRRLYRAAPASQQQLPQHQDQQPGIESAMTLRPRAEDQAYRGI